MTNIKTFLAILFMTMFGLSAGWVIRGHVFKQAALAAKVAHYNPDTGAFVLGVLIPQAPISELFDQVVEEPKLQPELKQPKAVKKKIKDNRIWSGSKGIMIDGE